jgi:hypothetical protein
LPLRRIWVPNARVLTYHLKSIAKKTLSNASFAIARTKSLGNQVVAIFSGGSLGVCDWHAMFDRAIF